MVHLKSYKSCDSIKSKRIYFLFVRQYQIEEETAPMIVRNFDVMIVLNESADRSTEVNLTTIKIYLGNPSKKDIAISIGLELQQNDGVRLCKEDENDEVYFSLSQDIDALEVVTKLRNAFVTKGCSVYLSDSN